MKETGQSFLRITFRSLPLCSITIYSLFQICIRSPSRYFSIRILSLIVRCLLMSFLSIQTSVIYIYPCMYG